MIISVAMAICFLGYAVCVAADQLSKAIFYHADKTAGRPQ